MKLRVLMLVALLLICTACAVGSAGPAGGSPASEPPPAYQLTPESSDAPADACSIGTQDDGSGGCTPCTDYEHCFSQSSDMEYFYSQIIPLVRQFSATTYSAMPDPSNWYFVEQGQTGYEGCSDPNGTYVTYSDMSYEYCPVDKSVYVGQQQMWDFYQEMGDAAPAVGIAHEWGHHVQTVAGITPTSQADLIAMEDQADCVAGAWSAWLVSQRVMVEDDFQDIGDLLTAIGSAEGPDRDHGTSSERQASFIYGFQHGMAGCSEFVPETPIY
jgi:hypothetical protein